MDRKSRLPNLKPSFERYKYLSQALNEYSLPRALQYEIICNYKLEGKVLDFGGGANSLYRKALICDDYSSVNIDPHIEPTWLLKVGETIPCDAEKFDTVFSLNTLEHIYDAKSVLEDISRVLKKGGEFVTSVPFMFPVHGHPDDFFRPTPSWYQKALVESGFSEVEVIPLTWGPFSNSSVCSGLPGPAKNLRKKMSLMLDLLYYKLSVKRRGEEKVNSELEAIATAFFVRAKK
ncbi:methyltransferase domain-containing protein [Vibrio europaeus]|uniref:class I SAM-dependent methyltransferase n=1 Tax=Vibrio europaeus TaxID=300876 RepID=UPI00233FB058|nr:methyltransferase domain-containing protein [Vibrio europaeus]MDC5850444.1 methyltransferase domain-containing protein [Vibrio europaeus]